MKYRKLRIAYATVCGVFCLLLIALWVRSYGREGMLFRGKECLLQSSNGTLRVRYYRPEFYYDTQTSAIKSRNGFLVERMPLWLSSRGLHLYRSNGLFLLELPYMFLLPIAALVTVVPQMRRLRFHFSLRTLLIATTLVTIFLGLIVYAAR
jgi:hypothetical protein